MIIQSIKVKGLRGFASEQSLNLAIPNGILGSGLTTIVGPNNSGKSTLIEAFKAVSNQSYQVPSFSVGKRNKHADGFVSISLYNQQGNYVKLSSIQKGGSQAEYTEYGVQKSEYKVFVVPSRRNFDAYFGKQEMNRDDFLSNSPFPSRRSIVYEHFHTRLFTIQKNPEEFNKILYKIFGKEIDWVIDESDEGQHFIKLSFERVSHNSDGAGEGLLSIFTIVDSLYDSKPEQTIIIDEPELSLHPALQKRLFKVIAKYAKDRQILISTHSPYFINWNYMMNGGSVARVINDGSGIEIFQLSEQVKLDLERLLNNLFNPHILGLVANEVFFLDEEIILTEGQEDVIYFERIIEILNIDLSGNFYGWGVGGAGNMGYILALLQDLGFKKVAVIFDADKEDDMLKLAKKYEQYSFHIIPTDDVRDKPEVKARDAVEGLIDQGGKEVKEKHSASVKNMFIKINEYMN